MAREGGQVAVRGVAGLAVATLLGAAAPEPLRLQPVRAADFVATIGVQVHLNYNAAWGAPQSPYADPARVERALAYLNPDGAGVRVLRETGFYARGTGYLDEMYRLGRLGYRWDIYIGYDSGHPDWSDQLAIMTGLQAAGYLAVAEGPLEVDNPGWGLVANAIRYRTQDGAIHTGWAAAVAGQRDLYARFRGKVPVALWSLAAPGNGGAGGLAEAAAGRLGTSVAALCDWGNVHFYQHDGKAPGNPEGGELKRTIGEETGLVPGKPFAITETGFNTLNDPQTHYFGTPEVNAQYVLAVLLQAFEAGSALTVLYELFDENTGHRGADAFENHWGLFAADGTPKPAATALHNLMLLAGDGGAQARRFTPGRVPATVSGLPPGGGALALQKSDGSVVVVLWSGANLLSDGTPVEPPTADVRLEVSAPARALRLYDPARSAQPVEVSRDARGATLALSDRVLVVMLASDTGSAEMRSAGPNLHSEGQRPVR